ncbi:hypothetical protein OCH239_12195 [Roseivivax halodurans JCM 10272]|uniref:histidine kinase n=1 Tax=Roseivivax halodurans JCM 10272 TaxID=1449350 RepID=X7ELC0_9RHOB|nr:ATP-binding protein [Roseivivax halodurans]ETX15956.1 hypothetical protein OCH239_12195 [Roseivivax halodurans JCM 10272]
MAADEVSAGEKRALRKPESWQSGDSRDLFPKRLTGLVVLTLIALTVLGGLAYSTYKGFQGNTYVAGENSIWVVGQIEPSALRYERALSRFLPDPGSSTAADDLRVSSELLLSRMNVVSVHLAQDQLELTAEDAALWVEVMTERPQIEAVADADSAASLQRAAEAAAAGAADFVETVRRFNVRAMLAAMDEAQDQRADLQTTVVRFATASFVLVSLLIGAVWAMIYSYRNLRRSRAKSASVRESLDRSYRLSGEGIMTVTKSYRIVMANPAATRMFGISDDDPDALRQLETQIRRIPKAPEDRAVLEGMVDAAAFEPESMSRAKPLRTKFRAERIDGSPLDVEASISVDRDESGRPVLIAFLRDVTEQLAREQELRAARDEALQAVEARLRFFAMMSHEMRTPITGVIAAIDAIVARADPSDEQKRLLKLADQSAKSALAQINNVLDLASLERGDAEVERVVFNLREVLSDVTEQYRPLAEQSGNRVVLDIPAEHSVDLKGPLPVFMRPFINLLSNAIKHTVKGTITVRARFREGEVAVEVEDTGPGIDELFHERIFEPFDMGPSVLKSGSSGLGLPIARRAVESLNGRIGVRSERDLGSTFWFTAQIPLADGASVPDASVSPPAASSPGDAGIRILLAEDNDLNRLLASEMISHLGYHVEEARNGVEAVDLAMAGAYDLILMDVNMPIMGGAEATGLIRAEGPSKAARIVGVTAFVAPDEAEKFRVCGMDEIIPKPLTSRELNRLLDLT